MRYAKTNMVMFILFFSSLSFLANAQTTEENLAKYWTYRTRLVEGFLEIGEGPGMSAPIRWRHPEDGIICWSDGIIDIGWYLGVLATEYHMLSHEDEYPFYKYEEFGGLSDVAQELYFALAAFERLDAQGEETLPCNDGTNALNGFFVRDDTPADFHSYFDGYDTVMADVLMNDDILLYSEMSQDQVYHLLMGFALVKRLVPSDLEVEGRVLNAWAKESANRIIQWVAETGDWMIYDPACDNKLVDRGEDARIMGYGTNQAIRYIMDNTVDYPPLPTTVTLWEQLSNFAFHFGSSDTTHMVMVLTAIGKGFGDETGDVLMSLASEYDWHIYPMLYGVLYSSELPSSWEAQKETMNTTMLSWLNEAPVDGDDMASPQPDGTSEHGWCNDNRFIREKNKHYVGGEGTEGQNYVGLDYMLLHNLYFIHSPEKWDMGDSDIDGGTDTDTDTDTVLDAGSDGQPKDGSCSCRNTSSRGTETRIGFLPAILRLCFEMLV